MFSDVDFIQDVPDLSLTLFSRCFDGFCENNELTTLTLDTWKVVLFIKVMFVSSTLSRRISAKLVAGG